MSEIVTWIDPDGVETLLRPLWALSGRMAPPVKFEEESVPGQAGSRLRDVHHGPRDYTMPLRIDGVDAADLRTKIRELTLAMDPTRGPGRIRVQSPIGDTRELNCRYAAGLELDETLGDTSTDVYQYAPTVFRAFDPYWYATSDVSQLFTAGAPATFFPFFPLRLVSSEVFADATVNNGGDVEAWPVWTITGPGSALVLRNLTTGKLLSLSTWLSAGGETLTIDTRPGIKTVTGDDGTNLFTTLTADSSLFPLARGDNLIRAELIGSNAASSVQLAFKPRYLTA